jgi:hypothetical protein
VQIKKKKGTFNDYDVQLSWGQLNAAYRALERFHADPLADEMFAELGWYLENVPGPGEDEDEYKAAKDAEKQAVEQGAEGGGEGAAPGELVGEPVGFEDENGELSMGEEVPGSEGPVAAEGPEPPPTHDEREEPQEADAYLERPPQRSLAA